MKFVSKGGTTSAHPILCDMGIQTLTCYTVSSAVFMNYLKLPNKNIYQELQGEENDEYFMKDEGGAKSCQRGTGANTYPLP